MRFLCAQWEKVCVSFFFRLPLLLRLVIVISTRSMYNNIESISSKKVLWRAAAALVVVVLRTLTYTVWRLFKFRLNSKCFWLAFWDWPMAIKSMKIDFPPLRATTNNWRTHNDHKKVYMWMNVHIFRHVNEATANEYVLCMIVPFPSTVTMMDIITCIEWTYSVQ